MFDSLSRLHVSPKKSYLILSKSAQYNRDRLLGVLGFQEAHLLVLYLGLPLISSRLSLSDCKTLLLKIDSRIRGWGGLQLSFAVRVQLIKSVLMSFNIYWAMAFILPKGVIRKIEQRLGSFLWKGALGDGYPKVTWNQVCQLIEEWGQRIQDILAVNLALMSRHLWRIIQGNCDSIWVNWIYHVLRPWVVYQVGMGASFLLWHDPWQSLGPLILQFPRGPQVTDTSAKAKLQTQVRLVFTTLGPPEDPDEQLYTLACYFGQIVDFGQALIESLGRNVYSLLQQKT
ncbi:UNVERIFIED_CONTAM: hypothetical protein Sangu_1872800 [Sesamum angustifolium]|uniref:Reverse transcriptase zinc-binding domain-containing protein n=1 Tax=Sesamum angustifolium TaxID=2727405 RepID=A0AAW2LTP7_9LAMI